MLLESEKVSDWSQRAWQLDIRLELDKTQWEMINLQGQKVSCNIVLREHHYKVLHRWYQTPRLMSKIFSGCSSKCWSCVNLNANFCHIWWDCYMIKPFLRIIGNEADRILGQNISFNMRTCLLHDLPEIKLSSPKKMLLINCAWPHRC